MTLTALAHPEAVNELDAAISWYDQGGQGRGDKFETAYDEALDRCLIWPESGTLCLLGDHDEEVRTAKVAKSSYRIVYFVHDETLWIVAIAHEGRRPGYWKDRLSDLL